MKKKRKRPAPLPLPQPTHLSSLSSPVPIDGILYFVCTTTHRAFLDWRYSPLGHAEIDRALRTCQSIKIWFPKSNNLIFTLTRHNVGTLSTATEQAEQ